MTRAHPSGRPRLRVLLALAFVLVAQSLAVDHLIGHTARGHNSGCAICVSASHAGNAVPSGSVQVDLPRPTDRVVVPAVVRQVEQSPPAVYRSRAPPAFA